MYKSKDRKTIPLFPELFPFGGKLDERNRWLRIAELIPWEELEDERWLRKKQKERNRIEGSFGHAKEHFGLDRVRYAGKEGSEMWVKAGLLAMNLRTAMKRA